MLSQATKAESQALTAVMAPDMYPANSSSDMFKDSAVKFSMKDTAQHCNKNPKFNGFVQQNQRLIF